MSTTKSMPKRSNAVTKGIKPRILRDEADYEAALARAEALFEASSGTPRGEELELWLLLIEQYESIAYPLELPDPIAAIRFRMEQQNLKPKDLIPYIGSKSKVSEVLSGQRSLSLSMIRKLAAWGIPAEVLLQESLCGPC